MPRLPAIPTASLPPMLESTALINADLAPIPPGGRTWSMWSIAALWVGMAICITTYTLASSLIEQGMNWKQAVLTIFLGNLIVLIPMTLNAHPGTAYGIPFPVLIRASFGTLRLQYPGTDARARRLRLVRHPDVDRRRGDLRDVGDYFRFRPDAENGAADHRHFGRRVCCFLIFWAINIFVIVKGMDSIKWLEIFAAPFLILTGAGLLIWAVVAAKGWGPIFAQPSRFHSLGEFWPVFTAGLTAMVGYWATLSLNIPDFSRFARSQRDQIAGQALGLPLSMTFYAFIGVAVTSATVVVFGKAIWDPVQLMERFHSPVLAVLALDHSCDRHAFDQHRGQRRLARERFLQPRAAPDQLQNRRHPHRNHRHPDVSLETLRRSERLHFHLADRLQRIVRPDRRDHDRGLFCLSEAAA